MRPSENVQFSERFEMIFESFSIVFGSFRTVFALVFVSCRRRRRRDVVFGVVVDRWIKKTSKKIFKNFVFFYHCVNNFDTLILHVGVVGQSVCWSLCQMIGQLVAWSLGCLLA